jgi:hypothetical protein
MVASYLGTVGRRRFEGHQPEYLGSRYSPRKKEKRAVGESKG